MTYPNIVKNLQDIANILRRDSIKMTTAARSGHPTSCLSAAEIMAVLFFNEMSYDKKNANNKDNDEFILSKGHAAPIYYSCLKHARCINKDLLKLRTQGSPLEGHPMPRSLKWVKVATGSLGQGLSVGVGMALASKLQKKDFRVYVLLGDSEIAEGSIYEALQLASYYKLDNLIAIVDINRLGQTGETMVGHNIALYKKRFNGFGWNVISCDGHNIKELLTTFKKSRKTKNPVMILAKTFKGKGVAFLENRDRWHGTPLNKHQLDLALKIIPNPQMPDIEIKKPKSHKQHELKRKKPKQNFYNVGNEIATRDAYGTALRNLAISDSNVIALDAEVSNSTKSDLVKKVRPGQFVEAYIAEQNMVGMALGLEKKGFNVFASTFSAFLTRAHDQIRMAAISNADFTICGSHCGVSIGKDGPSQMGLEDLAFFRTLPNSIIFYPSDAVSTEKLLFLCSKLKGLKYIRTTRPKTTIIYKNSENFPVGDFKVLKKSQKDKAVLVGAGITLHEALKAYEILKSKNVNSAVVDLYCVKPFNAKKLIEFVKKHGKKIVVVEDHYKQGGIGEMISKEIAVSKEKIKIKNLSVSKIPHSGTGEELMEKYKINSKAIVRAVMDLNKNN